MPIPDERLPIDDSEESMDPTQSERLEEEDELEFETADVDRVDDAMLDGDDSDEADTAGFGYGDPSD